MAYWAHKKLFKVYHIETLKTIIHTAQRVKNCFKYVKNGTETVDFHAKMSEKQAEKTVF